MALAPNEVYRVVANIPNGFDAVDMRNYFSFLTEQDAFNYFHYGRKPETHLMGSIIKIQASVTQSMKDKGFELSELSERNPRKYFVPAEEVFHSAEGSEQGDDGADSAATKSHSATDAITDSMAKMDIKTNKNAAADKAGDGMPNGIETSQPQDESASPDAEELIVSKDRFCCVVRIKREFDDIFKKFYHQKFWVTAAGDVLPVRCLILDFEPLQIVLDYVASGEDSPMKNRTKEQIYQEALHYTHCQMNQMQFFKSSDVLLPHGNVGEMTEAVEKTLKSYDLEPNKKLLADIGVRFDVNSNVRRFFKVPFYYHPSSDEQDEGEYDMTRYFPRAFTSNGDVIPSHQDFRQINRVDETVSRDYQIDYLRNVEYDSSAMDWHTYEEFHDAIQEKEKSREVQFQQDIVLPVTEEGSGVVQFFDGQFWCQNEGGEEVRALDGWEVNIELNGEFRKRMTKEEKKKLVQIWSEKNDGKSWTGMPKDDKLSEKELAARKYNYAINALAPYWVKYHMVSAMLYGKIKHPESSFNFPRALSKPTTVCKTVWNKHFETSWNELFAEINELRKRYLERVHADKKEKAKKAKATKPPQKTQKKVAPLSRNSRRGRGPALPTNRRGLNQSVMERVQRRFDREARAHPEWYGRSLYTPFSSKSPLLPGPFSGSQFGSGSGRYNAFDRYESQSFGNMYSGNRSAFNSAPNYDNRDLYSMYDNYGLYERYYNGARNTGNDEAKRQMELEMSYLSAQGYSYDSIQAIMKRKYYGNQFNSQPFLQNTGSDAYSRRSAPRAFGYGGDRGVRSGVPSYKKKEKTKPKKPASESDSEENAQPPTAHYKNDGEYTSGVALVHPQSSCIVKMQPDGAAKA